MIRINLAAPLLAKNARNGAPSNFVMEKWATRPAGSFVVLPRSHSSQKPGLNGPPPVRPKSRGIIIFFPEQVPA
jgi:hypothetical protein